MVKPWRRGEKRRFWGVEVEVLVFWYAMASFGGGQGELSEMAVMHGDGRVKRRKVAILGGFGTISWCQGEVRALW